MSITNESDDEFTYSGSVHTLDKSSDEMFSSGPMLLILLGTAKKSQNDNGEIEAEVIIKNLKEEAKDDDMESGVSDGE